MKNYSKETLLENLNDINWLEVEECENVDEAWSIFKDKFVNVIDKLAPITEVRLKQRGGDWFNGEILHLISNRDKALAKFKKSKKPEDYTHFKELRNLTQRTITKAKQEYIRNEIAENKSSPKSMWKVIKNLGVSSKSKSATSVIGLKDEQGNVVFDSEIVANCFNTFFTNIASKLVEKLGCSEYSKDDVDDFYCNKGVSKNSFSFNVVSEDEIKKLLESLNVHKSTGFDKISARFLKDGANVISCPLTYIMNLSLELSTVPSEFKVARVVPLYKKGCRNYEGNYRPVSILPVVSKIMEKVVYKQVNEYLMEHKLIYDLQSGFRSHYSTNSAVTYMSDMIRSNMDAGCYTGMVVLDLQKAFDTVNHEILLSKLDSVGFNVKTVKWFQSYLTGRKQYVEIDGKGSSFADVTCGVPQGSILGPMLFLMYVNDMERCISKDSQLLLYADDSVIVHSSKNVEEINSVLSREMESVHKWLVENRLSLHLGKTESIVFGTKRKLNKVNNLDVKCKGNTIVPQEKIKYLGVTFEQDLSGNTMATSVLSKVTRCLKMLYRKANFFDYDERKSICTALLQAHFDYGCNVWYRGLVKSLKSKVQCAQNKMIRYILKYDNRQHLDCKDFEKLNFLNVEKRIEYLTLSTMYDVFDLSAPMYILDLFERSGHGHNTRSSQNSFVIPYVKSNGHNSYQFNGALLWNSIPFPITDSKDNFKITCKKYLMGKMKQDEDCDFVY